MTIPRNIRLLRLFAIVASSASATSIHNDDAGEANKVVQASTATTMPTSNLIDVFMQKQSSFTLTTHALQTLREERIFGGMHRHLQKAGNSDAYTMFTSSSSHGQRGLKPDSTKSAKGGSKSAKSKSAKAQCGCETYEAELAALKEEMSTPKWLFAQVADKCILDMSGDAPTIESSSFHMDTEWFTDRPFRYENTTLTPDWFNNFNELFSDENGFPNAAMTLVKDDESLGVVVSAFVNGYTKDGEGEGDQTVYGYNLNQSDEQKKVKSLEELMGGADKVEFDHCSFFIDIIVIVCGALANGGDRQRQIIC